MITLSRSAWILAALYAIALLAFVNVSQANDRHLVSHNDYDIDANGSYGKPNEGLQRVSRRYRHYSPGFRSFGQRGFRKRGFGYRGLKHRRFAHGYYRPYYYGRRSFRGGFGKRHVYRRYH